MMGYDAFIVILFGLNAFKLIDILDSASIEKAGTMFSIAMFGSCAIGIILGAFCLSRIKFADWYGRLALLFFCDMILNIIIIIGLSIGHIDLRMLVIIFIQVPFVCVCGLVLTRLKRSLQKGQ